jgi:hypothetical protein
VPSRLRTFAVAVCAALAGLMAACGSPAGQLAADPPTSPTATATQPSPAPSSAAPATSPPAASPHSGSAPAVPPPGVTAGIAVFDRQTGTFTEQRNTALRFRSASLVKLLIALDYLWERGPDYAVPAGDRARFDAMLRSSDDNAATYFWNLQGGGSVVTRMVQRLGLQDTAPPPPDRRGWGSTAVSAADLVRIYRYLLDTAPAPVRDRVMNNLRQATRCAADGLDQLFGIPAAFGRPWAVKQGWYEFRGTPTGPCDQPIAASPGPTGRPPVVIPVANNVDFTGEVLHTTGTVGAGDRTIVVVLTLHHHGTPFATAAAALTRLTGALRVPGHG